MRREIASSTAPTAAVAAVTRSRRRGEACFRMSMELPGGRGRSGRNFGWNSVGTGPERGADAAHRLPAAEQWERAGEQPGFPVHAVYGVHTGETQGLAPPHPP